MKSLEFCGFHTLDTCPPYVALAFDGTDYYLAQRGTGYLHKYDSTFTQTDEFFAYRSYDSLCYDSELDCFWGISSTQRGKVYRLDKEFRETEVLSVFREGFTSFTGISPWDEEKLLLATDEGLGWIYKYSETEFHPISRVREMPNAVLKTSDAVLYGFYENHSQGIGLLHSDRLFAYLSGEYYVEDMSSACTVDGDKFLLLTTSRGRYSHLIWGEVVTIEETSFTDFCENGCSCTNSDCDDCTCDDCDCDTCCDCTELCTAASYVVDSVAAVEEALAEVLSAEGAKIAKVIASTSDIDEILSANESVRETIVTINHLEQVLYENLKLAKEIWENCDCDSGEET